MNPLIQQIIGESERGTAGEQPQNATERLQALDDLIAATSQKLEQLKQHKKGLMQHLAKNDSPTPPPPKGFVVGDTTGTSI